MGVLEEIFVDDPLREGDGIDADFVLVDTETQEHLGPGAHPSGTGQEVQEHQGPGEHPSGSPQAVHGVKGGEKKFQKAKKEEGEAAAKKAIEKEAGTEKPKKKTPDELRSEAKEMEVELEELYQQYVSTSDPDQKQAILDKHNALYRKQSELYGQAARIEEAVEKERVAQLAAEWGTEKEAEQPLQDFYEKWKDKGNDKWENPEYVREKELAKAIEERWENKIRRGITFGEITQEDAEKLGYRRGDGAKFKELPEDLWHVTTASDAVLADRLRTRQELGQMQGKGLGGGADDTISFTWDQSAAHSLYQGVVEAHQVANGEITTEDLLLAAHEKGFVDELLEQRAGSDGRGRNSWKGKKFTPEMLTDRVDELPDEVQEAIKGTEIVRSIMGKKPNKPGDWKPIKSSQWEDSPKLFGKWEKKADPESLRWDRFQFYKAFSYNRQQKTGRLDPLFFSTDVEGFAKVDRKQIRILRVKAKPKTRGYEVTAEKEWRVHFGDAVEIQGVEEFDPKKHNVIESIREHQGPGPHESGSPQEDNEAEEP